jgi:hypothetical protein
MKTRWLIVLILATPCFAGPTVTVLGGGSFPTSNIKIEGGGEERIGDAGGAAGIQLMVPVDDLISVGVDFLSNNFGEKTSDALLPPFHADYKFHSNVFLVGARLAMPDKEKFRAFVFGGLGLHNTSAWADLSPTTGFVWADTGTTEKRRIFDGSATGFAGALSVGFDYSVSSIISIGTEARYQYLAQTNFTTNSISSVVSTVGEIKGDSSAFALLLRLSMRF